jgi:hypothetical protein
VAELRSAVYPSAYYDALMQGDDNVLKTAGLIPKLRTMLLALVDSTCHETQTVSGAISCTMTAKIRIIAGSRPTASYNQWTETGAATSREEAIGRAAGIIIDRHTKITDMK